jgi:hypothetical protein
MPGLLYQNPPMGLLAERKPQGLLGEQPRAHTFGGIPMRQPFPSELDFFKRSGVPAYSSEDGAVVFNPFVQLSPEQRRSLEMNEAARVWMSRNPLKPNFALNPSQQSALRGTHYESASEDDRRATIAARLLSGDPSAGQPTAEQDAFVKRLRQAMGIR